MTLDVGETGWRPLLRSNDPAEVNVIATTIEAMEFDVRVLDLASGLPVDRPVGGPGRTQMESTGRLFLVEARTRDWADLTSVLDNIREEQFEFDAFFERRDRRAAQLRSVVLRTLIVLVAVLTLVGLLGGCRSSQLRLATR